MKRALTLSLTLGIATALAFPLVAEEPKQAPATQPAANAAAPAATTDSPLVQAAKRSKRRSSLKSIVITNDSVKSSKGRVTTSNAVPPPLNVPEPTAGPEQQLIDTNAKRAAEKKAYEERRAEALRKSAANRERVRADTAAQAEEGIYERLDSDPAAAERAAGAAAGDDKPPHE